MNLCSSSNRTSYLSPHSLCLHSPLTSSKKISSAQPILLAVLKRTIGLRQVELRQRSSFGWVHVFRTLPGLHLHLVSWGGGKWEAAPDCPTVMKVTFCSSLIWKKVY